MKCTAQRDISRELSLYAGSVQYIEIVNAIEMTYAVMNMYDVELSMLMTISKL